MVDISKYIRDDCKLISDKDVAVTVVIEALQSKEIIVPKDSIELLNIADNLEAFVNNESVSIVVWGVAGELDDLTVDDLKVSADLSGKVTPGMYNDVSLDITVPDGYLASDSASISVQIVSTLPEETDEPEATVKPTETPRPEETQSPESTGDPITTEPEESVTDTVISNSGTADTDTATDTDTPKNDIEQGN